MPRFPCSWCHLLEDRGYGVFGIGFTELVLILIVALLVLGPEKLVSLSMDGGRLLRELKRATSELRGGVEKVEEDSGKND